MTQRNSLRISILASALLTTFAASAAENATMEQISIFGSSNPVNNVPGSAHVINDVEIENFKYTDIMRTLASVPGVYIQEEDGYGLRPNIGMRGTGQNRSEKITVMEDGVLAAPAPYASPAAYYFPTSGRMQTVEVMKGGSTLKYGPRTTGGIINMISRQIPQEELSGGIDVAAGQDGFAKLHAHAGGQGERVGAVAEVYRYQADGFRDINGVGGDTGFTKNDALAKISIDSSEDAKYQQRVELKLKYSDEVSNETYMGLTEEDYNSSPFTRYSASQKDEMTTDHKQIQLNHIIDFSDTVTLATTAYYNNFARNWYKTSKVDGQSLNSGGIEAAADFDRAPASSSPIDVQVKANNREYLSQGIQTELNWLLGDHELSFGARYHEDEMDRFQWVDTYELNNNQVMSLTDSGTPGTDSNRIDSAEAFALYVQDQITLGDLAITAGLRYEDVTTQRRDWGKTNPGREGAPDKDISNSFDVLLPSVAATYQITEDLIVLAGVQKGFAPSAPGNDDGEEEESWNYEAGLRYHTGALSSEAIVFYSDYSNMHGNCTAAQGCDDDNIGNQYNAGEVEVTGLELSLGYEFNQTGEISFPVKMAYTYTSAEFQNSFSSDFESWGDVEKGDELPYLPENQLFVSAGVQAESWQVTIAGRYTSDMRTVAGQGTIPSEQLIADKTIVDLSARYFINDASEVYLTVDNLFDETYMTTRIHGSIFSGKPQTATVGYNYKF
ncbi:TonB-dependent receptor [Shewanella sp. 1_MG-2023]|uniref:TonB-dependent receptor family protein n=1 Tax=unclassified Shewanella TaxID=196818 RepID=UPI0026E353AF|nr:MULTISPECIES: TonB-dependent receptor [unclassified Shewanella]MDO6611570.1 TonB-dependent receptor [Shewanella sp. 7_MG-2023]MDO6771425.1 TonB-dependent receptor [Shewanella sp. 2_MG-2023]MDO6793651.1 TonB-dependent receptor [Shewanella sp. 1_MG-2023]